MLFLLFAQCKSDGFSAFTAMINFVFVPVVFYSLYTIAPLERNKEVKFNGGTTAGDCKKKAVRFIEIFSSTMSTERTEISIHTRTRTCNIDHCDNCISIYIYINSQWSSALRMWPKDRAEITELNTIFIVIEYSSGRRAIINCGIKSGAPETRRQIPPTHWHNYKGTATRIYSEQINQVNVKSNLFTREAASPWLVADAGYAIATKTAL